MLNDGYQYIEQRDADNNITHSGVVGKNSPFVTNDNRGILDVIAEDLRYLYDNYSAMEIQTILARITAVYTEMKSDPNWGATAAKLSAQEAIDAANKAVTAQKDVATNATTASTAAQSADTANKAIQKLYDEIQSMKTDLDAKANAAILSAADAKTAEGNAASHETNAHDSAIEAKNSEINAAKSADTAKENAEQTAKDKDSVKSIADEAIAIYQTTQQDIVCPNAANFGATDVLVCAGAAQMAQEDEMTNEQKTKPSTSPFYIDEDGYIALRGE